MQSKISKTDIYKMYRRIFRAETKKTDLRPKVWTSKKTYSRKNFNKKQIINLN
jgi:hypothetical protein